MKFNKLISFAVLTVVGFLATAGACSDPGDPNGGGKPHTFMVWIVPGSHTVTKAYYGLWRVVGDDPYGHPTMACRWAIRTHGQLVQSGGRHDAMIIGPSNRGNALTVGAACYKFSKV